MAIYHSGAIILIFVALSWSQKIENSLLTNLMEGELFDIIVTMKLGPNEIFDMLPADSSPLNSSNTITATTPGIRDSHLFTTGDPLAVDTRTEEVTKIATLLAEAVDFNQKRIVDFLVQRGDSFRSYWLTNQLFIQNADYDLVISLLDMDEIEKIREEEIMDLESFDENPDEGFSFELQWNLEKIGANQVWEKGYRGEGIIVGSIDSGVDVTHESLRGNYIGDFGWFDPTVKSFSENGKTLPYDKNGHGTHTVGIMVGGKGIGVAPGAKWMACRGCGIRCQESFLLDCAQFMACQESVKGKRFQCSRTPHIINNSWGTRPRSESHNGIFDRVIVSWRKMKIIPVFAQGNSGPMCETAEMPGNSADVIAVGATEEKDKIFKSGSMGPAPFSGLIKPDISAPGVNILSADAGGEYIRKSGTSMAAPHVAGSVALLLSAYSMNTKGQSATFEQIFQALSKGADVNLIPTGKNCGKIPESSFPNNAFGFGRLNVNRALSILLNTPPEDLPDLPTKPIQTNQPVSIIKDRKRCTLQYHLDLFRKFRIIEALAEIARCKILFLTGN